MTTEHKILWLIDRGTDDEAGILAVIDGHCTQGAIILAICADKITERRPGYLALTEKGLAQLNELEELSGK